MLTGAVQVTIGDPLMMNDYDYPSLLHQLFSQLWN